MTRKPVCLMLNILISIAILASCARSPQTAEIAARATVRPQEPEAVATSTIQPIEMAVSPAQTEEEETNINETVTEDPNAITGDPCDNLGNTYVHDKAIGEIIEDYIGSWHAAPSVGSAYSERFVFFASGNYLFFPSQYECAFDDPSCIPSPIEEGIWGVRDGQINLAIDGDINHVRSISVGKVIDSPADESPYPLKTTFDGTTYWLMSKDTNMWNPETGELCDWS